jgi:chitin synthase
VYYPVPNEVYRDEWDDVQVTDPMEFTHCRYTPVVTEVRAGGGGGACWRKEHVL